MKIVVTEPNLVPHRAVLEAGLPPGSNVVWTSGAAELEAEVGDAEVLVSSRVTAELGALGKQLKLVHVVGAGYERIDVASLPAGARVANTFHHEKSMAEYVLAATIMLRRGFLRQHLRLADGRWDSPAYDPASPWTTTLEGASVGFVGFGHIGSRAWDGLKAFGAMGHAVTRRGDVDAAAHGLRWTGSIDDLPQLLDEAEILVVSAPLTETTTGLIGATELAALGKDALLVNVGRGPVVDEQALFEALRDGVIGGAAIDVWYDYPSGGNTGRPSRFPFHELPNVLMTPHSSGVTLQTFAARAVEIAENITRLANGEQLRNVVAVAG